MADFVTNWSFNFNDAKRDIDNLINKARAAQGALPTDPRQARSRISEVEATAVSTVRQAAAQGRLPGGPEEVSRQTFQYISRIRSEFAKLSKELTGYVTQKPQVDKILDSRSGRYAGAVDLADLERRAQREAASDPRLQQRRIDAVNARRDEVRGDPRLKQDLAAITAAYRKIPEGIRSGLGLDLRELQGAAREIAYLRKSGGASSPALTLPAQKRAIETEGFLYENIANERALRDADKRGPGGGTGPGPLSNLRAEEAILVKQRTIAEKTAFEQMLAADKNLLDATTDLAVLQRQREARERLALAQGLSGAGFARQQAEARRQERLNEAEYRRASAAVLSEADTRDIGSGRAAQRSQSAKETAAEEQMLAVDSEYIKATAAASIARQKQANAIERELAQPRPRKDPVTGRFQSTDPYKDAAEGKILQERRTTAESLAYEKLYAADQALIDSTADLAAIRRSRALAERTAENRRRSTGPALDETTDAKVADQQRIAAEQRALAQRTLANNGALADEIARGRSAERARTAAIERGTQQRTQADRQYIEDTAQARVARQRTEQAIRAREREIITGRPADAGRGPTVVQRIQAAVASRRGEPQEASAFQTGSQFLASRLLTTVGFAASGALLYGSLAFMKEMVREASELQVELGLVAAQFEAAGISAERFGAFRETIISISKETGVQADELARLGRSLAGVFRDTDTQTGEDLGPDVGQVERELEVAAKFSTVTGVAAAQIKDDMTSIFTSFKATEPTTSFETIAQDMVAIEDRTGVAAGELLNFVSQLGPLGAELGFTSRELGAFGAAISQASGKSASALAENVGRVLTSLSERGGKVQKDILAFYQNTPEIRGSFDAIAGNFRDNDISAALRQLLVDYQKLDETSKVSLANAFGRREAQSFVALLGNADAALQTLNDTEQGDGGQAFDRRWEEHRNTVTFAFSQMQRAVEEFGIALFEAGVGDALKALASAGIALIEVLKPLLSVFAAINDVTGGGVGKLIAVSLAIRAVAEAVKYLKETQIVQAVTGAITGAVQSGTATAAAGQVVPASLGGGLTAPRPGGRIGALSARGAQALGTTGFLGAGAASGAGLAATIAPVAVTLAAVAAISFYSNQRRKAGQAEDRYAASLERLSDKNFERLQAGETISGDEAPAKYDRGFGGKSEQELIDEESRRREIDDVVAAARVGRDAFVLKAPSRARAENAYRQARTQFFAEELRKRGVLDASNDPNVAGLAPEEKARRSREVDELAKRQGDLYQQFAREVGPAGGAVLGGKKVDSAEINKILDEALADPRNREKFEAAKGLVTLFESDPAVAKLIDETLNSAKEVEEASSDLKTEENRIELYTAQFKRGERASQEVFQAFRDKAVDLETLANAALVSGDTAGYRAVRLQIIQNEEAARQFSDSVYQARLETQAIISDLTGTDTTFQQLAINLAAIRDPANSYQGDVAAARSVMTELRDQWDTQIENADTFSEVQRLLNEGFEVPPEVRQVIARTAFEDPRVKQALTEVKRTVAGRTPGNRFNRAGTYLPSEAMGPSILEGLGLGEGEEGLDALAKEFGDADAAGRQAIIDTFKARAESMRMFLDANDIDPGTSPEYANLLTIIQALEGLNTQLAQEGTSDAKLWNDALKRFLDARSQRVKLEADLAKSYLPTEDTEGRAAIDLDAARTILNDATQALQQAAPGADRQALQDAVTQAQINFNDLQRQIADEARQKAEAIAQAYADLAVAQAEASGDPIAAAQATLANAQRALAAAGNDVEKQIRARIAIIQAQQALEDAEQEVDDAFRELLVARAGDDAVEVAKINLAAAKEAAAKAIGAAERYRTQAALIQAQREYNAALLDVGISQKELALSLFNAAGDGVQAAHIQLQIALAKLRELRNNGAGQAEINRAQAEVISAQAAIRDARYSEQINDIDFALQMEKITTSEAIRQLEALLLVPNITKQQTQQLLLKIKGLRDELGQDYQFNLPSFLGLPTAYTARRVDQTSGGYTDQRQITVQVYPEPGMDVAALANATANAVGDRIAAPVRSTARRY